MAWPRSVAGLSAVTSGPDLSSPVVRPVEELTRAGHRCGPPAGSTEHLGELDDPAFVVQSLDRGDGPPVALTLGDLEMRVRIGSDLREVGHAQHLVVARKGPQRTPDGIRAATADARVDL